MLKPEFIAQFKKDYKLALKRRLNPRKLEAVVNLLCEEKPLPQKYKDHPLVDFCNYNRVRGGVPHRARLAFGLLNPKVGADIEAGAHRQPFGLVLIFDYHKTPLLQTAQRKLLSKNFIDSFRRYIVDYPHIGKAHRLSD